MAQVQWQRAGQPCNVQFVYDGDGNRLLKVEGGASLEITTYYAGQLFEKQFNTTTNPLGEGAATGGICAGATNGVTDYGFTGQRNETSFGLMDFNARYYSPRLGRFISPDSIVPDPTTAKGFNRYMYGNGNPLSYSDPTGHIAICFRGGQNVGREDEPNSGIFQLCQQSLDEAGYDPAVHGEIKFMNDNGVSAIQEAFDLILHRDAEEPAIVIGHSWGGAAALRLAGNLKSYQTYLQEQPLVNQELIDKANLDLLVTIDP